ncbi:MFS transporter [Arthrobacter sp. 35W]|uniref:MFS transporter n=1 Tax=Arthrobacter sp. 35W TaxID=1132441 RepID=UPI000423CCE0|nr:MFS transporter [Arthrobacter sp. 35W]
MTLRSNGPFVRFWLASTISDFGSYITSVALSVLILVTMHGTAADQGLANAARWAPYLLFGLLAGIWVDKFPRRWVLIAGDVGRGLVLAALCGLALAGMLTLPALMLLLFLFGTLALASDAAYQSYLPQLVPRRLLTRANALLQQSETVAQTTGSALAGALVAILTAPFALLLDALSYFISGAVLLTLRHDPPAPAARQESAGLRQRVVEGLRWVYRHQRLGPLALSTHIWFIGSAMVGAVVPAFVLTDLGVGAWGLGLVLGCAGVGAVLGTSVSTRLGARWGTGAAMVGARLAQPVAIALVALAAVVHALSGNDGVDAATEGPGQWPAELWTAFALAAAGQFLFGAAMGVEGPLEMGYRQAVTPDRLMARMSATMRSVNRGMIVLGAPLGGLAATVLGSAPVLWAAAAFLLAAALVLLFSPFASARIEDQQLSDEEALSQS